MSLSLSRIMTFIVTPISMAAPVAAQPDESVTFTRDIAPIIYENCAACHRPGESAPFSLLSYEDVRRRARQIRMVTASGYMPPWLPDRDVVTFAEERGLSDAEIELLRRWEGQGAPEGDPADLPAKPKWTEGWQLGEPDLVVRAPEVLPVPAEGIDLFRNLVIPVSVDRPRYVKAVELRPGNPRVVHHAIIQLDRTRASQRLDAADPGPGFGGMSMGKSEPPDGMFIGWTPGKVPSPGLEGMAWRLDPGADLVLQLHLLPSGRPEQIQPEIGLFFAEGPPEVRPFAITLRNDLLDIPAAEKDYVASDEFTIPVPVQVHLIYPHAHYLGRDLKAYATLPDGSRRWLIHIPDWDFNWQDEYRYDPPMDLPAGSVISLEYTYDNSADNIRNPNSPPKRVRTGNQSTDEMCTLTLQVQTSSTDERAALAEAFDRKSQEGLIVYALDQISRDAGDARSHEVLGTAYSSLGRVDEAIAAYEEALRLRPDFPDALVNLGSVYGELGRHDDAARQFRHVLELEPANADARSNLGVALEAMGRVDEAVEEYRAALALEMDHSGAHFSLGSALAREGRNDDAITHLRRALALRPDHVESRVNLSAVLSSKGLFTDAMKEAEIALKIAPEDVGARYNHAAALLALGRNAKAIEGFRTVIRQQPTHAKAHVNLAIALKRERRLDEAVSVLRQAVESNPEQVELHLELGTALLEQGRLTEAVAPLQRAVELDPLDAQTRLRLGVAFGAAGKLDDALAHLEESVRLAPDSAEGHTNLGLLLMMRGNHPEAVEHYRRAVDIEPDSLLALRGLAWILATHPDSNLRDPDEAVQRAERAAELTRFLNPPILDTLAAAYAASGRFEEATRTAEQAASLAGQSGNDAMASMIRSRLALYQRSQPYIEQKKQ